MQLAAVLQRKEFLPAFNGMPIDHTFVICTLSAKVQAQWVHPALGGSMPNLKGNSPKV